MRLQCPAALLTEAKLKCLGGIVPGDLAPHRRSLWPHLVARATSKLEKEIKVGSSPIPSPLPKTMYGPVSVSIQFCLDPLQSRAGKSDHKRANPFLMVPGATPTKLPQPPPLLCHDPVSCALLLRKTSSDLSWLHQSQPSLLSLLPLGPHVQGCWLRCQQRTCCLKRGGGFLGFLDKAVFCLSTRGLLVKLRHDLQA